jgi:hypothetical protein
MNLNLNLNFDFNLFQQKKEKPRVILDFESFAKKVFNEKLGFFDIYDFQLDMCNWALNQENTSLLIATRGIGKSYFVTCLCTLYRVYCDPTTTILIVTNQHKKSKQLLLVIHGIINANKEFFSDIFNDDSIHKESIRTIQNENKKKEPSIYISSLGTSLRGHHPDYIVFDDVITMENSFYETKRDQANRLYYEAKALTNNILIIGNVTHPLDLYSTLRFKKDISVYEIYNDDERIPLDLRADIDKLRAEGVSEYSIQANYFGVLMPDETLPFFNVKIQTITDFSLLQRNLFSIYVDFAMGGKDSNCLTMCFLHNFKIYCFGFSRTGLWSDFLKEFVVPFMHKFKQNQLSYESNNVGFEPAKYLDYHGITSFALPTKMNKKAKISRLYQFKNDIILLSIQNDDNQHFISQFRNYSPRDNQCLDDGVDCTTMNLMLMNYISN